MKLVGDMFADVAQFLGFAECDGCKRRKKKLNAAHAKLRGKRRAPCPECVKARRIG